MIGQTISHYRVLRRLGGGGMGIVYEAEDLNLGRRVALKFLPDELARDPQALERFQREARAASAINHPNICTVHEIGSARGQTFIAMELLEGQTLKHRIASGPLTTSAVIDVGIQIAGAIAAAHERGIVHRDIKPANIFLCSNGHAKLLDFGLAKMLAVSVVSRGDDDVTDAGQLTRTGVIVGTAAYMSPEQVRGEELDKRTDLFSFGVVLYEIATGVLPFRGNSPSATMESILQRPPVSVAILNPEVPPKLSEIIEKTLEKDREVRCQSAAELQADLKRFKRDRDSAASGRALSAVNPASRATAVPRRSWTGYARAGVIVLLLVAAGAIALKLRPTAATSADLASVAVLPFQNATSDMNNEYLSDGLTEDLINTLSQFPNVKVMARSTVFRFKGDDDPRQVGRKLNVNAVLIGRLTKRGDELGIHAELVNTADGTEMWGGQYSRDLAQFATIQDDIARDISSKLRIRLAGGVQPLLTRGNTSDAHAYQLYQEGRFYWNGRTSEGLRKSIELFQQAIAADPNYALAYTGLADSYNVIPSYNTGIGAREAHVLAEKAARKALSLDGSLAEAHSAMAFALANERRWDEAEREFQEALKLNSNNANAHYFFAFTVLTPEKRVEEALREMHAALSLDPLSPIINTNLAAVLLTARRYPESLAQFQHTLELDPSFGPAHQKLSFLYAGMGRWEEAVGEWQKFMYCEGSWSADAKGYSRLSSSALLQARQKSGYVPASFIAAAYAVGSDREETFKWLKEAETGEDEQLGVYVRYPMFDGIRSDPRYADMMRRLNLPE